MTTLGRGSSTLFCSTNISRLLFFGLNFCLLAPVFNGLRFLHSFPVYMFSSLGLSDFWLVSSLSALEDDNWAARLSGLCENFVMLQTTVVQNNFCDAPNHGPRFARFGGARFTRFDRTFLAMRLLSPLYDFRR